MKQISINLFGTPDYMDVLDIMAPSDKRVKEFWRQCQEAGYCDDNSTQCYLRVFLFKCPYYIIKFTRHEMICEYPRGETLEI